MKRNGTAIGGWSNSADEILQRMNARKNRAQVRLTIIASALVAFGALLGFAFGGA